MNASSRFFNGEAFCVRRDACPCTMGRHYLQSMTLAEKTPF